MLSQVQFWAPSAFPAIAEKGHLPMDWMQVLFASLAPGSAAKIRVELGKTQAFGDANGDGAEDAAITLIVNTGGSGTFTSLALVINDKGLPRVSPLVALGDRILVKSLAIQNGTVTVTLLTRKPEEPMIAAPTVEVTQVFTWQGGALVPSK